jgi:hypothetical protein
MTFLRTLWNFFFPASIDVTGKWRGSYKFGSQYSKKTQRLRIAFSVDLRMKGVSIEGIVRDENEIPEIATIEGSFGGRRIAFVKTYQKAWSIDSKGKFSPSGDGPLYVNYTGIYNASKKCFTGEWKIEGTYHFEDGTQRNIVSTGTWEMKRKSHERKLKVDAYTG